MAETQDNRFRRNTSNQYGGTHILGISFGLHLEDRLFGLHVEDRLFDALSVDHPSTPGPGEPGARRSAPSRLLKVTLL